MRKKLGLFLLVPIIFTAACNPVYNGKGQPLAQMTFNHIKPYPIYVASYEPVKLNSSTILPEGFIADPADLAFKYLNARFNAVGSTGKLRVVIKSLDVSHKIKSLENSISNTLGIGKQDHYLVRLVIKLQLYGQNDDEPLQTTLIAHRNIYVSEFASVVEREETQMKALDALIDDVDRSIRHVLSDKFSIL